jgi:hypothetical protein
MALCWCDEGWVCEEHPERPWPHDACSGPGVPCDNPACQYGRAAIARKPIDEAINRERYPDLFKG